MGTRAAFFVGDFRNIDNREWLGCIALDGYPERLPTVVSARTENAFRLAVESLYSRNDFASPDGPFPFPWMDDLCLTDCTYCWHDGQVWCEWERRFVPLSRVESLEDDKDETKLRADFPVEDCNDIPAPGRTYDGTAPDSIMIIGVRS